MAFSRRRGNSARRSTDADLLDEQTPATPIPWRRLFAYLQPYRGRMILALLALAVYSVVNLAFPFIIMQLLGAVEQRKELQQLNTFTLQLIILFLIQAAFVFVQSYELNYVGERIVYDLRTQLYQHLHTLSFDFFANRRVGEIVSRLSNDVTKVQGLLTQGIIQLLSMSITLIGSVILVFLLNPSLMVFILVLAPLLVGSAILFGRPLQRLGTKVQDELALATVAAEEGLQGVRVVKSFTREPFEVQRYTDAMQRTFMATMRQLIYRSGFGALMSFFGFGAIAAILWFSGREVIAGRLTLASITGFVIYAINIASSLGGLAGLYGQFRETLGATRRLFELMDTQPTIQDAPDAVKLPAVKGQITFDHVSFSYDGRIQVLDDINLRIAPGEIIALVGPSGAGKSTLFNLIPRFYDPTSGVIRVDDDDVRHVTQQSLRMQIGIVPQDTLLFGGTIRENILYGRLDASEEELIAAAKAANAHTFITELPDQYATLIGERGVKLSGGQRQRIAIARAILKDPRILLLDEATSSLDSESEELVQEALDHLMQNRTTVIIAHRLSTIKIADRICVLDHGKIVELGTHDALMADNGLYARLYTMQFRNTEELLS